MEDLLRQSMPPDPDLVDLIEWAFLEGQIDGAKADLAYSQLLLVYGAVTGHFAAINSQN